MISLFELITLLVVITSILLFFFFLQLDKIRSNNYGYVYAILIVIFILGIIELLSVSLPDTLIEITFPVYLSIYFLMYPLMYLYAKRLVFTKKELKNERTYLFYIFPIIAFFVSIFYYASIPLNEKIDIMQWHIDDFTSGSSADNFVLIITVLYYLQVLIFFLLFLKIYNSAKGNMSDRIIDKNVVLSWLRYFIIVFLFYEIPVGLFLYFFPFPGYETALQLIGLIFLTFLGILRINQSTIEIQTRLRKAKLNLEEINDTGSRYIFEPEEKNELMSLIKETLKKKKFFTDPNLTIDQFAKKIHASSRKLSIVINEITGESFSQLLNKYRIEEAKKLLLSSDDNLSIENIYLQTGFNSRSTFNRVFKSYTGLTPKEFKTSTPTY